MQIFVTEGLNVSVVYNGKSTSLQVGKNEITLTE